MDYSILLPQIHRLHAQVPKSRILLVLIKTLFASTFPKEKHKKSLAYIYLTRLLWEYIAETLPPALLLLEEPKMHDPLQVTWKRRKVTQTLAHAILDYHTITSSLEVEKVKVVLSLGASQWQLAYVFLKQMPLLRYIVVDELPMLHAVHQDLERLFPEKALFASRSFESYSSVQHAFEAASICFILPHQLPLLPAKSIDLGIAIDVLDKLDQQELKAYFSRFSCLMTRYFYFKQVQQGSLKEADYQVPDDWEEVFWRTCSLYPHSFEALFVQAER